MANDFYWVSHQRKIFGFIITSYPKGDIHPDRIIRIPGKTPDEPIDWRADPKIVLQQLQITLYELRAVGKHQGGEWVLEWLGDDPNDAEKMEGFYRSP